MFADARTDHTAHSPRAPLRAMTPKVTLRKLRGAARFAAAWSHQHNGLALLGAINGAASELRAPLAKVNVLLELMDAWSHRCTLERLSPRTSRVRTAISALDGAIQAMLGLAASTGDALDYDPEMLDLADLAEAAVSLARPVAHERTITITCCAAGRTAVWADGQLLLQAIDNILDHMLKEARRGGVLLCEVTQARGQAIVRVTDDARIATGVETARIFRPFDGSRPAADDHVPTPDLKLWLARLIAERHGGGAAAMTDEAGAVANLELRIPLSAG